MTWKNEARQFLQSLYLGKALSVTFLRVLSVPRDSLFFLADI